MFGGWTHSSFTGGVILTTKTTRMNKMRETNAKVWWTCLCCIQTACKKSEFQISGFSPFKRPSGKFERAIHLRHCWKLNQNIQKTSFCTLFPPNNSPNMLLSGTTKTWDNFKFSLLTCNVKKGCSFICGALVFCWHRTPPKLGRLQSALPDVLWKEALIHHLWCLGLCWHRTPPKLEQLQGALPQLLWKEALLHYQSCPGLCWHRTQPAIGQLQSVHDKQLRVEACVHCLSCLGLCWHPSQPEIGQLQCSQNKQLGVEALLHCLSCLGLYWHPSQPEIGQLQGALCEQQW